MTAWPSFSFCSVLFLFLHSLTEKITTGDKSKESGRTIRYIGITGFVKFIAHNWLRASLYHHIGQKKWASISARRAYKRVIIEVCISNSHFIGKATWHSSKTTLVPKYLSCAEAVKPWYCLHSRILCHKMSIRNNGQLISIGLARNEKDDGIHAESNFTILYASSWKSKEMRRGVRIAAIPASPQCK